jgi:tripartite-type tricarboxylate transporter receptor subunit TctC
VPAHALVVALPWRFPRSRILLKVPRTMSSPLRARRSFSAFVSTGLLALALVGAAAPAHAQRVIRIVVPFGTGAVQDTIARSINNELGAALNASVIVENRAGAGGTVGASLVAKSPPDGNTLVLAAASHNIAGHLYAKLPYDTLKDFVGVASVGNAGYVLMVSSALGAATTADFIREVKANPGRYNYASAGNGSATHLAMAAFLAKAGLQMTHIPMKSTGEAVNEVLAGRVQAVISSSIGVIGLQNDARVKSLASTGRRRSPFLPNLPTVEESGLPGYDFDSWIGLLAPAGMPKAEIDRINAAVNQVMAEPAMKERFTRLGVEPRTSSAEEFQKLLRADYDTMGAVVKASGARID